MVKLGIETGGQEIEGRRERGGKTAFGNEFTLLFKLHISIFFVALLFLLLYFFCFVLFCFVFLFCFLFCFVFLFLFFVLFFVFCFVDWDGGHC